MAAESLGLEVNVQKHTRQTAFDRALTNHRLQHSKPSQPYEPVREPRAQARRCARHDHRATAQPGVTQMLARAGT